MHRCLLAFLLVAAASPASAGRWTSVIDNAERAVYVDTAALAREGNQVRAWVREVHTGEQRSEQAGVNYFSANGLIAYDCLVRTAAPLFKVFFGADGTELRRINLDAAETPALAVPGSLQEQLLERACAFSAKPAKDAGRESPRETAREAAKEAAKDTGKEAAEAGASTRPPASPMAAKAGDHDKADQHAPSPTPAAAGALHAEKAGVEKTDKKTAAEPAKPAKAGAPDKPDAPARPSSPSAKAGTPALPAAHAGGERERAMPMTSPIRTVEQASALANGYVTPMRVSVRRTGKLVQEKPKGEHPPAHEVHWSYGGSGGPANWGRLKSEYETCARGTRQSPIDIRDGARLELEPIRFDYKASPLRILDNGHTVQVNYVEGSSMTIAGERFDLKQFHFHKPAEERIDGRSFALVAHLVHQSAEGRLAVVAVLFDLGEQDNAFLRMLWPHLPLEAGREAVNTAVSVDVNGLLPEARTYFTYMGSLTTPPCSEGVRWIVLKTPLEISPEQVAVFGRLYTANARPIQPSNGRLIKESM